MMSSKDEGEAQKKMGLEGLGHDELVTKCKNLLSIAQRAKKARDDALEENGRFKQDISNMKSKESDMELQMDNMTKTISSLTDQKIHLMKQIDEVAALNGHLKQNLWDVRQELHTMRETNECLENENKKHCEQLKEVNEKLKKEISFRDQLETDKNNLNEDLQKLTENTEQMKIICKQIAEERITLEEELDKIKNELSNLDKEKNEWISFLKKEFPEEELNCSTTWIEFFNNFIIKFNDIRKKTENKNLEDNNILYNEIEKLNLIIKELSNDKDCMINEITELKTENNRVSENLDELNSVRDTLLKKLDEVRIETQQLIENSEKLSEENTVIKLDKNKLEEELNNILNEKSQLSEELEQIKLDYKDVNVENEKLHDSIKILNDNFEKINTDLEIISSEKNNILKEYNELNHNYSKSVEENTKMQEKYEDLLVTNKILNKNVQEFDANIFNYKNKLTDYINEVLSKDKIIEKLDLENNTLKENNKVLENRLKEITKSNDDLNNSIDKKNKNLLSEMNSIKKELINLSEYIIEKLNENCDKNTILENIEDDENCDVFNVIECIKSYINKLNDEKILFKDNLDELNINLSNFHIKIDDNEKVINNLKLEKQQIKNLLEEKVTENNNMIKSLENLKLELENISRNISNTEKEKNCNNDNTENKNEKIINDIQIEKERLMDELKILRSENDQLHQKLNGITTKNNELLIEIKNLKTKNDDIVKNIETLNKTIKDIEENLKAKINENEELNNYNALLEKINKNIIKEIQDSINNYLKYFSLDTEFQYDEHNNKNNINEFIIKFKNTLDIIKDCNVKKENEIKQLQNELIKKESHINSINEQNILTDRELNLFKNILGKVDELLNVGDTSIDLKEKILKQISDNNMMITDLCNSYSNYFGVDNEEALKCVNEKLNLIKDNNWAVKFQNDKIASSKVQESDQTWEIINDKERLKIEENDKQNGVSEINGIIKEKDKEISELQDKIKELKMVAVKLKKKVTELNQQLENERQKHESDKNKLISLTAAAKNAQTLQQECDRLNDELEETKKKMKSIRKTCDILEESETKLKQRVSELETTLEAKDEEIISLKSQSENSQSSLHNIQKELAEMQKEKAAQDVIVKELERELLSVQEKLKTTKLNLEQAKQESRKQSVLSLEMQDYEKSVKDLTTQISLEKEHVKQMEEELDAKTDIQNSLQEQIVLLEQRIATEEERSNLFNDQLAQTRENLKKAEQISMERAQQISIMMVQLESEKSNKDVLAVQISDLTAENQKQIESTRLQNEALLNRVSKLEYDLRCSEMKRERVQEEMAIINQEFEAYKVRAQSVLRQRAGTAAEREAKEECIRLQDVINHNKAKFELIRSELEKYKSELSLATTEKETLEKKCENLNNIILQRNKELDRQMNEHRSHKISTDTLIQCYKTQLEEKERGYQMELDSLRDQLAKLMNKYETEVGNGTGEIESSVKEVFASVEMEMTTSETNDSAHVLSHRPPLIEREDGEGSEGNESPSNSADHSRPGLIPLEKLLSSPSLSEDEKDIFSSEKLENMRTEILASNTRLRHLTALLSESEKDSARKEEQIAVLKEEIRRLQRCIERQPHAHNTEYLKNVIVKFVTLHSGDERSRLVPVLDTILKLSPEEHKQLAAVAKGETDQSSTWGLYLPSWPSLQS
ncbi:uncharacterized protein LOC142333500 [Lycorma delicatula]|uniref:uncharacterized protein LOC142333500 n=1 Tax=Lycorma delicatula TaxID=130591 RepID=UPI003F515DF1